MGVSACEPQFTAVCRRGSGYMLSKEPPGSTKIIIISWKNKIKWRFKNAYLWASVSRAPEWYIILS